MKSGKNLVIWLIIFLVLSAIVSTFGEKARMAKVEQMAFSDFINEAENKHISEVNIPGHDITGKTSDGKDFYTYAPNDPTMFETLRQNGVRVNAKPIDTSANTFWGIVVSWFPMLLLVGVWIFFMRQANSGNNKAMSFGKSRARLIENSKKVT